MLNNLLLKIFLIFIDIIDSKNKKKIIYFFKKKFKKKFINVIDIGAHKGETIDLILNNFNVEKIFSFEPNKKLYENLRNKYFKKRDFIQILNLGIGQNNEIKELNIMTDTSSSTFNEIDKKSVYFQRKEKIFNFFSNNKNFFDQKQKIKIDSLSNIIEEKNIKNINILKIDTEGYEYNVLKGLNVENFKIIDFIYFEHHFDLMIKKNYKYSDIDKLLKENNFFLDFKIKMNFRKSFEYIYKNEKKTFS